MHQFFSSYFHVMSCRRVDTAKRYARNFNPPPPILPATTIATPLTPRHIFLSMSVVARWAGQDLDALRADGAAGLER